MSEQEQLELGKESGEAKSVTIDAAELEALRRTQEELRTKLNAEQIERAKLEERMKREDPKAPEAPAKVTREQLQAAVENGEITQAQMDTEIARQMREEIRADLAKEFDQKQVASDQKRTLKQRFDEYVELHPEVMEEGAEDRRRVQEEVKSLTDLGYPYDMRTEVLAMRNVFGPAKRIPETTRQRRETHRESGGPGGSSGGESKEAKWEKGLTSSQIGIYREQLAKGLYKGANDPLFQRVTTRARTQNQERGAA